jgi:hypothetical protein
MEDGGFAPPSMIVFKFWSKRYALAKKSGVSPLEVFDRATNI